MKAWQRTKEDGSLFVPFIGIVLFVLLGFAYVTREYWRTEHLPSPDGSVTLMVTRLFESTRVVVKSNLKETDSQILFDEPASFMGDDPQLREVYWLPGSNRVHILYQVEISEYVLEYEVNVNPFACKKIKDGRR